MYIFTITRFDTILRFQVNYLRNHDILFWAQSLLFRVLLFGINLMTLILEKNIKNNEKHVLFGYFCIRITTKEITNMQNTAINFLSESTQIDFKETLEVKKAKSWLKSISAFANGVGETLVFGIRDKDRQIVRVDNPQDIIAKLSELIQARIKPQTQVEIQVSEVEGKQIVFAKVNSGQIPPYFYVQDNTHTAFVRLGDQSISATEQQLTELILRGKNETFDSLISKYKKSDFSFTLFEATFKEKTGTRLEPTDYLSFGLISEK